MHKTGEGTLQWDISSATYNSVNLDISSQDTIGSGLDFNDTGTKMYMCGTQSDSVHQYTLSTPWSLATASYDSVSKSVSAQTTAPSGVRFNSAGTTMFVSGSNESIFAFSLSSAWDLSTVSAGSFASASVSSQMTNLTGFHFKPDGTKLYATADEPAPTGAVYQYTLSTPWDLTTMSYDSVSYTTDAQENSPRDVYIRSDGKKMFLTGVHFDATFQYTLSTAWDISSASYDSVMVNSPGSLVGPRAATFDPNGTKMYMVEPADRLIYELDL